MARQSSDPRRRDPAARTREILAAGTAILKEEGAAELTHRAVAARAGLALGTVPKYLPAIGLLREKALTHLSEEIAAELDELEPILLQIPTNPDMVARTMYDYPLDRNRVRAALTLTVTGAYGPELRHLDRRWTKRMTDIFAQHIGQRRALSLAIFFEGAAINSALNDFPVDRQFLIDTTRAMLNMDDADETANSKEGASHEH